MKVIAVGKIKEKASAELIREYEKRLQSYTKLELIEVADEMAPAGNSEAQNRQVMEKEGQRILARIKEKDYVILLDLHGRMMDSISFSKQLSTVMTYQTSSIVFVIGGSLGVSEAVVKRADLRWKLSDCTFPHQLVRILVLEQIYRAFKIQKHEPYHK